MRYLVTGATGFIGNRLARQLIEADHEVVTVARNPSRAQDLVHLGVSVYEGDITRKETLRAPMTAVNGVFHVAGWYSIGPRDRSPGMAINVEGTRNVLELMSELEIPRGVYTSTLAVFSSTGGRVPDETYRYDGPHLTEYDRTKWLAHHEVAEPMVQAGLPLIIVQPGVVYGPGDTSPVHTTFQAYVTGRLRVLPRDTAYCWGYVDDVARGHILAMERGRTGENYIIAGECKTVIEVMEIAERLTGIPAAKRTVGPGMMRAMARAVRPLERVVSLPQAYTYEGLMSTAGATYLGSNYKARRELGYEPRPLEEGLRETLAWEMEQAGVQLPAGR